MPQIRSIIVSHLSLPFNYHYSVVQREKVGERSLFPPSWATPAQAHALQSCTSLHSSPSHNTHSRSSPPPPSSLLPQSATQIPPSHSTPLPPTTPLQSCSSPKPPLSSTPPNHRPQYRLLLRAQPSSPIRKPTLQPPQHRPLLFLPHPISHNHINEVPIDLPTPAPPSPKPLPTIPLNIS